MQLLGLGPESTTEGTENCPQPLGGAAALSAPGPASSPSIKTKYSFPYYRIFLRASCELEPDCVSAPLTPPLSSLASQVN